MKTKQIKKTLQSLDFFILLVKANGGYKYREKIKASEKDIADYLAHSEQDLKKVAVSLLVAEEMLQERGYWDKEPRWEEYLKRRDEALKVGKV